MEYGRTSEHKAIDKYVCLHKEMTVNLTGFFIDLKDPFLGASPDRSVFHPCGDCGLIEVKCPYKHLKATINEALQDRAFCLQRTGDKIHLKRSHDYHFQIQGELGVTGKKWAELIVYTESDLFVARIPYDLDMWTSMVADLRDAYCSQICQSFIRALIEDE